MKPLPILIALVFIVPSYADDIKQFFGKDTEYRIVRQEKEWNRLTLLRKDKVIGEITPKYVDKFTNFCHASYDMLWVISIYDDLTPRPLHKNIFPFDDITGDGISNLVIMERPFGGNNPPFVVRVLSINQDSVTEYEAIEGGGEVFYFADFNDDGVLEFVNTDSERDFVYDDEGMPISDHVWRFNKKQKRYHRTSSLSNTKEIKTLEKK